MLNLSTIILNLNFELCHVSSTIVLVLQSLVPHFSLAVKIVKKYKIIDIDIFIFYVIFFHVKYFIINLILFLKIFLIKFKII